MAAMVPAFRAVGVGAIERILPQKSATTVPPDGRRIIVPSSVHRAPKVLLQLLIDLRVSHVQADFSSHRIPRGAHTVSNVQQGTYSQRVRKVPARASTGSMRKIVRASSS